MRLALCTLPSLAAVLMLNCGGGGSSSPKLPDPPSALTYTVNPATYAKGQAIAANSPSNSGGKVTAYAVNPILPSGLLLAADTGIISGTPSATYSITASNAGGSTAMSLTLTVTDQAPSALAYSAPTAVYGRGVQISPNTPSNGGGTPTAYAVSPALPAGLSLSASTGILTGTPTALSPASPYVVTASNSGGATSATLTLSVQDLPPTSLSYASNPATYTRGVAITANTPSNGGGPITGYAVSPALPAGLTLNASTGSITGTPTALAPASAYVITGSNSVGSTTVSLNLAVVDVAPSKLVYKTNPAGYNQGTAITANTPSNGGGVATSYSVAPPLPAGLSLNPATGAITGTPTVLAASAVYTITAGNSAGSTTAQLTLAVYAPGAVNIYIKNVELTQSSQTLTNDVPIVAGRPGLVRVFVLASQINSLTPEVSITLLNNGVAVSGYPKTVLTPFGVPTTLDESSLSSSANLAIPGSDLTTPQGSGYSLQVTLDPLAKVADADRSDNNATIALQSVTVPIFRVTIFPVHLDSGYGNINAANKADWVARLAKMYPIVDMDVQVGAFFTGSVSTLSSDGGNWSTLLSDLAVKHQTDAASNRYYYGAVNVSYSSGTAGMGYVPTAGSGYQYRTALGWDKSSGYNDGGLFPDVFSHETGHNMSLNHAPCGGVSNSDQNYPYAGGLIGVWGWDPVLNVLRSPLSTKDMMGYCTPNWVSDYHYKKILAFRNSSGSFLEVGPAVQSDLANTPECLIVRGILHANGQAELLPGFRTTAPATAQPAQSEFQVTGLDAAGRNLFSVPVELVELGCGTEDRHFLAALPLAASVLDAVASVQVLKQGQPQALASRRALPANARIVQAAPALKRLGADKLQLNWDATVHPAVMVRDPATGEVLAILQGGQRELRTLGSRMDLVFSDGVSGHTERIEAN